MLTTPIGERRKSLKAKLGGGRGTGFKPSRICTMLCKDCSGDSSLPSMNSARNHAYDSAHFASETERRWQWPRADVASRSHHQSHCMVALHSKGQCLGPQCKPGHRSGTPWWPEAQYLPWPTRPPDHLTQKGAAAPSTSAPTRGVLTLMSIAPLAPINYEAATAIAPLRLAGLNAPPTPSALCWPTLQPPPPPLS